MKQFRKWTALICAGIMAVFFLAGCGGDGDSDDASALSEPQKEKKKTMTAEEENTEKSMGRYLEKEVLLPEEIGEMSQYPFSYMERLESGNLMLAERIAGKYISPDDGESWESVGCPWSDIAKEIYVTDMAISPEGAVAMIGVSTGGNESEFEENETMEAAETETSEVAVATSDSGGVSVTYHYYYVDAEGNRTKLELPDDIELRKFAFDNENRLYGYAGGGKVYRIDPADGSKKELFTADGSVDYACFTEKYMVCVTTRSAVAIYDVEQEIMLDVDEVLQNFIKENLGLSIGSSDMGHSVILTAGEQEDIIYFAFEGGLYRHVIGGTAIEQIIDGGVSTFGDPSAMLMGMTMLPDNEFMVLYTGMKLYRYTYDPNVPTVPDQQLKIYSLKENTSLRQAVSMFQKAHQDVYIRYEIGMSGGDGVTREDAIRNLNTKIMSGEGPDILLLDGLPQTSYEEKGILADMSAVIDGMSGDAAIFPNIVDACRRDGKIYALPVRIQIPAIVGRPEDVQNVKDISSLADTLEKIREENPEGALLGVRTPEQLLYILRMSCSAVWTDEKGTIDEGALEEFLTAAKRIWQAEISGVSEDELGASESGYGTIDSQFAEYYGNVANGAEAIAMGSEQFGIGKITSVDFEYDMVTTLIEEGYDMEIKAWDGQVKNGFIPYGLAGVAANSMDNETAIEFYQYLFSKELQDMSIYLGLPVNMSSFDELKENPRGGLVEGMDDRYAGSIGTSTPEGEIFGVELMWPTEEDFQKLKDMVSSASAVSTGDTVIESTVYEIGPRALEGSVTPKEAVQEIVKKSAIYLAE